MKGIKTIFVISIIMLFALFANSLYIQYFSEDTNRREVPAPIVDDNIPGQAKQLLGNLESSVIEENPVNLMVLGLDGDKTRCDVIMLLHFVPASSQLSIVSVARDTRVVSDGAYERINALYSKGAEKRIARELTKITGLPVHYYITVDFKGFRRIIDTLGGVEFYVPFNMNYDDPTQNLHIHLKKGLQMLNGKKAEQLVRYRKGNKKGHGYTEGDIGRIKMQQDFLRELVKQKLNIKILPKAVEIFDILKQYVKTNIKITDVTYYMKSVSKVRSDEIQALTLPGTSRLIKGKWYFIYDREKTAELMETHLR